MLQGFFPDFHPVLVGAGCLALGYVYGRRCRAASDVPPGDEPAAATLEEDACCAQSQSNTQCLEGERCKCCMSAPAELDTGKKDKGSKRSPFMIQDAAEGFEQAERSAKRDLAHRNSVDPHGHHMHDKMVCTEGEAHAIHQHPCRPSILATFEKSYQMLEEEQVLQTKTPCKKQKGTSPAVKESVCSKGKAEMEDAAVESHVPWSRELLNRRIDYFNKGRLESEASDSRRSDESRKLRHFKRNFLEARAAAGEATYNSCVSTSSLISSHGAERSTCHVGGLVPLATPDHVDCSHDDTNSGVFAQQGSTQTVSEEAGPDSAFRIVGRLPTGNDHLEVAALEKVVLCELQAEVLQTDLGLPQNPEGDQAEVLQTDASPPQIPEDDHVPDRCSDGMELKEVPAVSDEVLKAEIFGLLNEADCREVSFHGIISLLEGRLQTDFQESKAHIATLLREVGRISELLEEEGPPAEAELKQNEATDIHDKELSSCSKSPVSGAAQPSLSDTSGLRLVVDLSEVW